MANNASSRGAASSPLLAISTRCPSGGEGSSFITHGLLQTSPRRQRIARICRHEGATVDWIFRRWGRSVTVPSMTGVPTSDRHSFLDGGRSDQSASSLRTEDQSARRVPAMPRGLLRRAGRPGVSSPCRSCLCFPWDSLVFLFVPSKRLSRLRGNGTPRAEWGIRAGQRPVALVGVTGFESAASSSRTGDHSSLLCC